MSDHSIIIYTDGGAQPNPGIGGYGAVLMSGQHRKELSGSEPQTTNNRMELTAVIVALEALKNPSQVTLYSDSKYIIDAITKGWLAGWQRRNWKKADKKPVENQDLWQRLLPQLSNHEIDWQWVKGHAGIPENERCDELAGLAIADLRAQLTLDSET